VRDIYTTLPKNPLRPIMIFIARTTGITETSGTVFCPFY